MMATIILFRQRLSNLLKPQGMQLGRDKCSKNRTCYLSCSCHVAEDSAFSYRILAAAMFSAELPACLIDEDLFPICSRLQNDSTISAPHCLLWLGLPLERILSTFLHDIQQYWRSTDKKKSKKRGGVTLRYRFANPCNCLVMILLYITTTYVSG